MTILEAENEISKLRERIETTKLEIEWQQLVGEDFSVLLQKKNVYEKQLADLVKYKEETTLENAAKLSDEYYDKVLVKKIKDNLDVLKSRLLNKKSLSKEEQDEVRALAKLQRNTGIINESLNRAGTVLEAPKFSVFAVEDKKANADALPVGYDYKGILEMCESLLEANREKYFEIIFYNPEINMVKPELLNWYLEKFDIKSEIERIAKLPAYLTDCISKENFDRLVKLDNKISCITDRHDEFLLGIILKSPHLTEKFVNDNADYIFLDYYYFSLVLSNPSLSTDFKKEVLEKNVDSFRKYPLHFYSSMGKLDDEKLLSGSTPISFLNVSLNNEFISFKNVYTGEADWIPDYSYNFFEKCFYHNSTNRESYDEFVKLLSLRSVLIGNSLTYNRLDKYISFGNLRKSWHILGSTMAYLERNNVTDFSNDMYEYISNIIDALAVIYSKNGKLDEFVKELGEYKKILDERYSRPVDVNEKTSNAYLYRLATLLGEKLKYYTEVKDKNQVLISSSDKMYNNGYTIDDIDKIYVKEILGKKEGISL